MSKLKGFNDKAWYEEINDILKGYHRNCKSLGAQSYYDVPEDAYAIKMGAQQFRLKYPFKKDKCIYVKNKADALKDKHNRYFEKIYDVDTCKFVDGVWKEDVPNRASRYGRGLCWVKSDDAKCGQYGEEAIIRKRKDINTVTLAKRAEERCNAQAGCTWSKLSGEPLDCVRKNLVQKKRNFVDMPPNIMPVDATDANSRIEQFLFDWYTKENPGPAPQVKELFGTGNRCISNTKSKGKETKNIDPLKTKEYDILSSADLLSSSVHKRIEQILSMLDDQHTLRLLKALRDNKDKAFVESQIKMIRKNLVEVYLDYMHKVNDQQNDIEEESGFAPSIPQSVVNMVMKNIALKNSSNRGLMALHSTGSGKTCTATGVIDAFWDTDKFIIFASSIDAVASNPPFKFHECAARLFARFKKEPFTGANEQERLVKISAAFQARGILFHPFAKLANRITKTEKFKNLIIKAKAGSDIAKPSMLVSRLATLYNKKHSVIQEALSASKISSLDEFIDLDKSVLIIDEVHNLFRPLPTQKAKHQLVEKHLAPKLHPNLKVVILTATPGDNVEDVVKLLNIVRDPKRPAITAPDVDKQESIQAFKESLRGMISFFDMSSDTTQFPIVVDNPPIKYPMSIKQFERYVEAYKEVKESMTDYDKLAKSNQLAKFWAGPRKYSNMLYNFEKGMQLSEFSSKLPALLENVQKYKNEKHYIYSAFYENRGSSQGILEIARQLDAIGYKKLTVADARAFNKKGELPDKAKRYVLALQKDLEGSPGLNLSELLKIYNHKDNINGELVHVFLATQGFNEGLDLKAVRHIHMFEPLITMASDLQTIGRARRYCSHAELEWPNQWTVLIHRYQSDLPIQTDFVDVAQLEKQVKDLEKDIETITDRKLVAAKKKELKAVSSEMKKAVKNDLTKIKNIDEFIHNNALEKMKQLVTIHQAIKEAAIDCRLLNKFHNMNKKCL